MANIDTMSAAVEEESAESEFVTEKRGNRSSEVVGLLPLIEELDARLMPG